MDPLRPMPPIALDLEAVGKESRLLGHGGVSWSDEDVPLHERGVELRWLSDFVWTVRRDLNRALEEHESRARASNSLDWVPEPDPLPFRADQEMTPEFLVPNVIRPLSERLASPL
jgi:hypothetical protein